MLIRLSLLFVGALAIGSAHASLADEFDSDSSTATPSSKLSKRRIVKRENLSEAPRPAAVKNLKFDATYGNDLRTSCDEIAFATIQDPDSFNGARKEANQNYVLLQREQCQSAQSRVKTLAYCLNLLILSNPIETAPLIANLSKLRAQGWELFRYDLNESRRNAIVNLMVSLEYRIFMMEKFRDLCRVSLLASASHVSAALKDHQPESDQRTVPHTYLVSSGKRIVQICMSPYVNPTLNNQELNLLRDLQSFLE
jgi:hypothetical protein